MRKKIVFMLINMNIGGTEKALLNMINEMPKDQYDVTIFMLEEYGGFLEFIPSEVKVKYFSDYQSIKEMLNRPPQFVALNLLKKGKVIKSLTIVFLHFITKIINNRSLFFKYIVRKYPTHDEEYDVAVAYDGPMDFISYFVLKKIKAKKKIQWIHFDVTKTGFNPKFASKVYSKFDKVFVVSKEARKKLVYRVPVLNEKTDTFINISSPQGVIRQSKEGKGFTDSFNGLRILTVGRLSAEKGQDLAIHALARLVKDGYKVKWYCIGDGNSRREYERLIKEYNLEDKFILLGTDPNPYPYIDQCNIYVQPSRHEGYCLTLAEARYLKKPIVTTCFTGAKEQIKNGVNGLIVGISEDEIYQALVKLINDQDLRVKFSKNLATEKSNNKYKMINIFA
ncbi:glycosyltransferase [Neobacillus vireti]|uniref:Group 1 glycosyl transferase n=1 Tax=Neobacillus vireti LMG 21834 TaxID=1131730 RepID=A0AB94IKK1_9BACI|nr:glycosyltransferase [Neobacillus vireti]ETI67552.1 group 1 glycosyl transferase [Neobacillus vireti LMG 21834]KLT18496.1 galactosyl transferase [Neobacillus vireti]